MKTTKNIEAIVKDIIENELYNYNECVLDNQHRDSLDAALDLLGVPTEGEPFGKNYQNYYCRDFFYNYFYEDVVQGKMTSEQYICLIKDAVKEDLKETVLVL